MWKNQMSMRTVQWAIILVGMMTVPVSATEPTSYYVLAIGVGKYQGDAVASVPCGRDAKGLLEQFKYSKVNYRGESVTDEKATAAGIKTAISGIKDKVKPGDFVILFLAGHGSPINKDSWMFLPHDFDSKNPADTSISDTYLLKEAEALAAKGHHVLLAVEACYSGQLVQKAYLNGMVASKRLPRPIRGGLIITTACMPNQFAYINPEGGIFSKSLQDTLRGNAVNKDGVVTLGDFTTYLSKRLEYARYSLPKYPGMAWPKQDVVTMFSPEVTWGMEIIRTPRERAVDPADAEFIPPGPDIFQDLRTGPAPVGVWRHEWIVGGTQAKPVKAVYTLTFKEDNTYTAQLVNRFGEVAETKGTYEYTTGPGSKFVLHYGADSDALQYLGRDKETMTVRVQPDKSYRGTGTITLKLVNTK